MLRALLLSIFLVAGVGVTSVYDFKVPGLDGKTIDLARFKGKKLLIVNTASKCGFTPQYADLEKLYEQYKDKLVIVGFPANNFHQQEPGSNAEISEFCKKNYGVTFPMAEKVDVVGENTHPLFKYLTEEAKKMGVADPVIGWNFTKFLIDEKGQLVAVFPSKIKPMDEQITKYLN
jgi:glutathione peroxidase